MQNQKKFKKLLTNNNAYVSIYELSLRNDKRTTKFLIHFRMTLAILPSITVVLEFIISDDVHWKSFIHFQGWLLFNYQSSLLLVWSSLSILSNRKKFVNNFFHLFSNLFLIWWNLCCFALFSLTAWLWYHSYFELSTVFLIFLIICWISFPSFKIRCCYRC